MISNLVFINFAVISEGWGYGGDRLWMFSDLIILLGASFLKVQFVYVLVLPTSSLNSHSQTHLKHIQKAFGLKVAKLRL